jgi:hypothetical protein
VGIVDSWAACGGWSRWIRLVTSPIRRHVTFGGMSVVIQAGISEFKLAGRSEYMPLPRTTNKF